jgi:hypothetical protein
MTMRPIQSAVIGALLLAGLAYFFRYETVPVGGSGSPCALRLDRVTGDTTFICGKHSAPVTPLAD